MSVNAVGTGTIYQWEVSKDGGTTWNAISNQTATYYTTPNLWVNLDNGNKYRAIAASTCFNPYHYATSHVATATVSTVTTTPVRLIMYDNFSDLSYSSGQIATNNSLWYTATPTLVSATDGTGLEITPSSSTSTLYLGYFHDQCVVTLGVTNALLVTIPFTLGDMENPVVVGPLRFGVFDYYDGGSRVNTDDALVTGSAGKGQSVRGYMSDMDFGTNFTRTRQCKLCTGPKFWIQT